MANADNEAPRRRTRAFPVQIPFAESPWLELELAERPDLPDEDRRLLRDYHRDGLAYVRGVASDELIDRIRGEVAGLFHPDEKEGPASYYRRQDAWEESPAVKELALLPRVLDALELLYGRSPVPFQTLNFLYGSQQANHSDAILFNTLPPRFMCGVWVALEDVTEENGPLFYLPGSHRLPQLYPEDFDLGRETPDQFINGRYWGYLESLMAASGVERQVFLAKKGDAVIWASNVVHGGMPRLDPERTRWSQVTHYFFADCVCYVPLYSEPVAGEFFLRDVKDFRGGGLVRQTYNGHPFEAVPARGGRSTLRFEHAPTAATPFVSTGMAAVLDPADPMALLIREGNPSGIVQFSLDDWRDHEDGLLVAGWSTHGERPTRIDDTVRISLVSAGKVYLLPTERMARPDVAAAFGPEHEHSGFRAGLDKEDLPPGSYALGLVLTAEGESPRFLPLGRTTTIGG
ncbi:MAG TPA: phytanoyl-CoA dioxygenase family protein [Thermoanaerobaculia bacterium]|jgi:hypothetical protein|nr:phytanoyl-CoA dioxygenase family protein [Thermoanaerobaculia bacterium]